MLKPNSIVISLLILFSSFSFAQNQIGVAAAVNKNTTDLTLEQERKLVAAGYKIIQNHTIETDNIGRAQMLLVDGTAFTVGPNSSVTLDRFIYNPETADGSLEVTSRGLLRLVGGKVTKKTPAIIRTNAATVGIRGGIAIVQTQGQSTKAAFVYGDLMTVTPTQNSDGATTLTEDGFVVTVQNPSDNIEYPDLLTAESLSILQEDLQAEEKEEESDEDSSDDDSTSEDDSTSDDDSTSEDDSTSDDDNTADDSTSDDTSTEETATETDTDTDTDTDAQPDVDESALDSSGISDNSSEVDPDDLSTADDLEASVDVDIDGSDDIEEEVAEETSEAAETSVDEVAPIFEVSADESIESISENVTNETLIPLVFINPGELAYSVTITGDDAELVEFDSETLSINLISALDYETQTKLSFTVTIESENADVSEIDVLLDITNIDEPIELTSNLLADSFAENIDLQSDILESTAIDPEGGTISFTLSGEGSENFNVDANGNISLQAELDYETTTSYDLTLTASDGVNETVYEFNISVIDVDEPAILTASTSATSFAEDSLTGINIGTATATDPEGKTVTFSLSGTGSENFSVDSSGNISLVNSLDYETATSYTLALNASDGVNTTTSELLILVGDVNEAPSLSNTLAAASFAENVSTGTIIATASASDPESQTITYSLSGTGSDNFSVDSSGNITLSSALDYETTTSYSLTLTASDGTNSTSNTINISVDDVIELSIALASSTISLSEAASSGTSVTTTTTTTDGNGSVTYSLSGTGSDKFAVSSNGTVTTAASLDYETTTSYSLTLTATDGTNTVTENLTVNITDVDLSLSASLASSAQSEGISTGTSIATSSTSNAEGTVTYSLTDADNKFSINSSTGAVTLANALDYETKTSHQFTITATDGVTTTSETFTLSVSDLKISTLAVTLANSGAALAESSSSGTTVGSSSITNPESETVSYSLSGTGSSNFAVDSSGNITTNATLDFETAKSYSLTLTATAGGNTTTDTFTVNVGNVEELNSAVLRYSAAYNSASRSGFSATATRGPSGSSLPAYTLEQISTDPSALITSTDETNANYVQAIVNSGSELNWRYYFPTDDEERLYVFAPNEKSLDRPLKSILGTVVSTSIDHLEVITAGRLSGAGFWFMSYDRSAANINFTSALSRDKGTLIIYGNGMGGNASGYSRTGWENAISAAGLDTVTLSTLLPDDISGYSLIVDYRLQYSNKTSYTSEISDLATWLQNDSANTLVLMVGEQCCEAAQMLAYGNLLLDAVGGGEVGSAERDSAQDTEDFDISSSVVSSLFSTLSGDQFFCNGCGSKITQVSGSGVNLTPYLSFWSGSELGSNYNGNIFMSTDIEWQTANVGTQENQQLLNALADLPNQTATTTSSTYNIYEDQVTIAGIITTDSNFTSVTTSKQVYGFAVVPVEEFSTNGGAGNDYFYPNFINTSAWSYGDVGLDYCAAIGNSCPGTAQYAESYDWHNRLFDASSDLNSDRFDDTYQHMPEGMSLWWQVLNPNGLGVGLWAQISFKDGYDGASGSTTRDDQQSLLNVVISNIDYRKNDTTRYSAGDTGLGMDGYHYWSYQGATNADNNGLGIVYGTSPIECATSSESGCFYGYSNKAPQAAMLTSSDPYKSGSMTLGVNYDSNNDSFSTGSFNQAIVRQRISDFNRQEESQTLSEFRHAEFYSSSASSYSGFFSGILEFDVSGTGNSQLASMRSSSTLATFSFDSTNDDVQVVAPMTISAAPSNNYTSNWSTVDTGSMTLKFGDATNDEAKSAYISNEVFGAEIQDDGAQVDGTSGGSNNLAGVMVSYNTLDNEDSDLFHTGGNDSMPDTTYSTWGFWAMSSVDVSPNSGTQNASVHMGTWVGGETLAQNYIPTSGTASMSGAAVMNVAYRYNQTGTNYDVHKYTTTADVAATFNWGASGYSGTLAFTNFDDKNPIVDNAGFASFSVAITGTDHTYTGNSTDSLDNSWLGGASVAGALYGSDVPDESGGRVNVNLYKSGSTGTAGANDFYFAEGIYLVN